MGAYGAVEVVVLHMWSSKRWWLYRVCAHGRALNVPPGAALADLGPGLGDMVLRCGCYLEGLEVTEKRMGWSARSGKIVLRIALQRLRRQVESSGSYLQ